jgi:hypothetical protein
VIGVLLLWFLILFRSASRRYASFYRDVLCAPVPWLITVQYTADAMLAWTVIELFDRVTRTNAARSSRRWAFCLHRLHRPHRDGVETAPGVRRWPSRRKSCFQSSRPLRSHSWGGLVWGLGQIGKENCRMTALTRQLSPAVLAALAAVRPKRHSIGNTRWPRRRHMASRSGAIADQLLDGAERPQP